MSKSVHLYELSDAMRLVLEQGGEVSFVTAGVSMLPLLRNRMDTAFLHKPLLRGDNLHEKEYGIRNDQVIAVLIAVRRGDRLIPMQSVQNRLYVLFLPLVRLYRFWIYPLYVRCLAPLVRKITKK